MFTANRCEFCGSQAPIGGLTTLSLYVGGRGYEATTCCADRAACSRRQDRQAQLVKMQRTLEATRAERRILR